jgi:tetratricopeptide (TPR) repeat protein
MAYRIKTVPKPTLMDDAHLLSGVERFWLKVEEHRRAVLGGVVLVIAAAATVVAAVYYDHLQSEQATDLYRQATQFYLTRPAADPQKADENLKKAIGLYRQVVDQYPRTATGHLATYELGNALTQANDLAGAIEVYRKYLGTYQDNQTLRALVHQRLAFAYLLNGDRDQAAQQFAKVLEVPGALNKDQALFELGKMEEAQSRPEGALARYQDLMKSYPRSPFAAEAEVRIKALGGGKPDVPPPAAPAASPPAAPDVEGKPQGM